jgi:hypothetical protein
LEGNSLFLIEGIVRTAAKCRQSRWEFGEHSLFFCRTRPNGAARAVGSFPRKWVFGDLKVKDCFSTTRNWSSASETAEFVSFWTLMRH